MEARGKAHKRRAQLGAGRRAQGFVEYSVPASYRAVELSLESYLEPPTGSPWLDHGAAKVGEVRSLWLEK